MLDKMAHWAEKTRRWKREKRAYQGEVDWAAIHPLPLPAPPPLLALGGCGGSSGAALREWDGDDEDTAVEEDREESGFGEYENEEDQAKEQQLRELLSNRGPFVIPSREYSGASCENGNNGITDERERKANGRAMTMMTLAPNTAQIKDKLTRCVFYHFPRSIWEKLRRWLCGFCAKGMMVLTAKQ